MRAVRVVLILVLGQHVPELPFVEDQHPVQALGADGADPALGVGVGLCRSRWTTEHRNSGIGEHCIEAGSEFGVAIAYQEPEAASLLA